MTKSELIRKVAADVGCSLAKAERAVESFFSSMSTAMEDGKRIELRGFGVFEMREYDGYMGRNPKSGETVNVPPKRMPFFKMGKNAISDEMVETETRGTGTDD